MFKYSLLLQPGTGGFTWERKEKHSNGRFESRKKLLHAAYKLFAEKGYYNTNTKEITRYAGISIGNFYNYYQDKGEIYCALLMEYTADSCRAMQVINRPAYGTLKAVLLIRTFFPLI